MKPKLTAYIIFLVIVALPLLALAGCSDRQSSFQNSAPTYSGSSTNNSSSTGYSESSTNKPEDNSSDDTASNLPKGEPTFLIGLDGKAILTSEITRLKNTDKTADTLTMDDIGAMAFCDGFVYLKEPTELLTVATLTPNCSTCRILFFWERCPKTKTSGSAFMSATKSAD